jgi:hypothetical protein
VINGLLDPAMCEGSVRVFEQCVCCVCEVEIPGEVKMWRPLLVTTDLGYDNMYEFFLF